MFNKLFDYLNGIAVQGFWPLVGAAALGGLAGWAGSQTKGGELEFNPYGQLNPEQVNMTQQLGPLLQNYLSGGSPMYTGQMTAGLTPEEQANISRANTLYGQSMPYLSQIASGIFPEDYYQNAIYKPMMKQYTEDILPLIQEQYAGPTGAGYWGSARANAAARSTRDIADTLAAKRAELAYEQMRLAPTALGALGSALTTNQALQQIPREISQLGLDKSYQEWVRTRPENYVNSALDFLGLRTQSATQEPVSQPGWASLLGGAASGALGYGMLQGFGGGNISRTGAIQGGVGGTNTGMQSINSINNGQPFPTWSPYDQYGNRIYR